VQSIAEVSGMEGEIITLRDLFAFQYRGERRDGQIDGEFVSTRMRPDFVSRAAPSTDRAAEVRLYLHLVIAALGSVGLLGVILLMVLRTDRRRQSRQRRLQKFVATPGQEETGP
jgi:hypothetical protein